MIDYLIYGYIIFIGAMIGSFLNVVIYRLPLNKDLVFKRSHCPKCNRNIPWYNNIPIFSYLFLRGKCLYCKSGIKIRYLIVELFSGFVGLFLYFKYGLSLELGIYSIIMAVFICHFFIDLDHSILPDSLNLILLVTALYITYSNSTWQFSLIGGAIGFGGTLGVTMLFYFLKGKMGMGGGDIKLYGILGILLGPLGIIQNIFLSCFLGTLIMLTLIVIKKINKDQPAPFGPSIILIACWQIFIPDNFNQFFEAFNSIVSPY